ncbi:MAG: hypothetical protein LBG16_00530, partial [Elusimicrobiota bacterium]|nr:hypothetical protein [Elusimicrobiota bacterium]
MKINNISKTAWAWGAVFALYGAFIIFFSIVYPFGLDEFTYYPHTLRHAVDIYFYEHVAQNPRAGHIFTVLFLWAGKWLFVIANAAVQT